MEEWDKKVRLRCATAMSRQGQSIAVLIVTLTCMTGCLGPRAILTTRQKYNEVLHRTANEQLLLNLVRLRYRDPPSFLQLARMSHCADSCLAFWPP